MKLFRKLAVLLIIIGVLAAASCLAEDGEIRILVAETTDIHGYAMDVSSGNPAKFQYRLAYIARQIDEARNSGLYDDVILLDGGDIYQGTPVSVLTGGASVRAALDMMGYDAVGLGNHDFDWDVKEYAADEEGTIPPYVLGDYVGDPKTPVLASGLYDAATGERVSFTKDYTVLEKAGKRIAVIGYIPDFRTKIMAEKIAPYRIDGSLESLDALVRQVREAEQPDAVIVLAHENPERVAEAMDPELVQIVAGGHTHQTDTGTAENGICRLQGRHNAQGFASAVLVIGPQGVSVEDIRDTDIMADRSRLLDTEENAANLDSGIMELSRLTWDAVSDEMSEVLGYIDRPVLAERRVGACSGGNWFTGLMLRATQHAGTVAAFYNAGGIRASFRIPEGAETRNITVYDVYIIAPFGNTLLVYDISGAELKQLLADGLRNPSYGDQMTGLTFTYSATGSPGMDRAEREYTILSITLSDGTEVDPEDTETLYRVCTTNFNATVSGSVFIGKEPVIPEADSPVENETFIQLLREEGRANGGYLAVDDGPRGVEVEAETETEQEAPAA